MLKFLRKYNKWILVIGGTLLMIAFLAPQGVSMLPKLRDRTIATMDGKPVKASRVAKADAELRAMNALGGQIPIANFVLQLTAPSQTEQAIEWYLLSREAEEAGFAGSDQDGAGLYPLLAQDLAIAQAREVSRQNNLPESFALQLAQSYVEPWLNRLQSAQAGAAGSAGMESVEELHMALGKLRGVLRMRLAYAASARLSLPRATRGGTETFGAARVEYVIIPATRFTDAVMDPAEEQILTHFEQYADKLPGETEFGIGYRQPQRVKLEWLTLDREGIENAITIDAVEASKHQQLNKERFPKSFSEERPNIAAELKGQKAQQIMGQAENFVRAEMLRATRTLDRRDGYVSLPADWSAQHPSLESIAQLVVEKVAEANQGLRIPQPSVTVRASEWLTQAEVNALPGFGGSFTRVGSFELPAFAAVFSVKELNPNPNLPLQVGLLASEHPLTGRGDGNRYFFRVLDARNASAPESVDEVREDVVRDLKRLEAYQRVVAELGGYTEVAINAGLDEVVSAVNAGLSEESTERVLVLPAVLRSRVGQGTPSIFTDEDVLGAALDVSRPLDPTRKIEDIPLPDRTFAAPAPKSLAVVVGRVAELLPLTREDFATNYNEISSVLTQLEITDHSQVDNPFTYERLKQRHAWTPKGIDTETEEAAEPEPAS